MAEHDRKLARLEKDLKFFEREAERTYGEEHLNALRQVREVLQAIKREHELVQEENRNLQIAVDKITKLRNQRL